MRALLLQALSENTQHNTVTLCVANKAEKKGHFPQLNVARPFNKSTFLLVETCGLATLYPVSLLVIV